MWLTKLLWTSSEGLFRIPSDRISHCIHIFRTSCCQLPVWSGIFCLLIKFVYRLCGLKFVYPVKLPANFFLQSFEWFYFQISSDTKYFLLLSKTLWLRINSCYSILLSNLKQNKLIISSSSPMFIETSRSRIVMVLSIPDKRFNTFQKSIRLIVNVTARLVFDLAYYQVAVLHVSHNIARTPSSSPYEKLLLS